MQEVCRSETMHNAIMANMNELAVQNKFNGLEKVKKIYLHDEEMTQDNGLLTPSMKTKRHEAVKVFRTQIDNMYS